MDMESRLAGAARLIYAYERSVGKGEGESWMKPRRIENGRMSLRLSEPKSARAILEYGSRCKEYLRFGREVDGCLADSIKRYTALMLRSKTPEILLEIGVPDRPWLHGIAHVKDEVHRKDGIHSKYHGLTVAQLKRIPERLEEPCVIFDNKDGKHGIVCVLDDMDGEGYPLIVPFIPDGEGMYFGRHLKEANFALSVYGHESMGWQLEKAAQEKRLLYIDHEKTENLLSCAGIRFPGACSRYPDKAIIRQSTKTVNQQEGDTADLDDLEQMEDSSRSFCQNGGTYSRYTISR